MSVSKVQILCVSEFQSHSVGTNGQDCLPHVSTWKVVPCFAGVRKDFSGAKQGEESPWACYLSQDICFTVSFSVKYSQPLRRVDQLVGTSGGGGRAPGEDFHVNDVRLLIRSVPSRFRFRVGLAPVLSVVVLYLRTVHKQMILNDAYAVDWIMRTGREGISFAF